MPQYTPHPGKIPETHTMASFGTNPPGRNVSAWPSHLAISKNKAIIALRTTDRMGDKEIASDAAPPDRTYVVSRRQLNGRRSRVDRRRAQRNGRHEFSITHGLTLGCRRLNSDLYAVARPDSLFRFPSARDRRSHSLCGRPRFPCQRSCSCGALPPECCGNGIENLARLSFR